MQEPLSAISQVWANRAHPAHESQEVQKNPIPRLLKSRPTQVGREAQGSLSPLNGFALPPTSGQTAAAQSFLWAPWRRHLSICHPSSSSAFVAFRLLHLLAQPIKAAWRAIFPVGAVAVQEGAEGEKRQKPNNMKSGESKDGGARAP